MRIHSPSHTQRGFHFAGASRPKRTLPTMAELKAGLRRAEESLGIVGGPYKRRINGKRQ